jgi:hypothetical protein
MAKNKTHPSNTITRVEILETLDCSGFTQEIRDHYKSHILLLVQRQIPDGERISFAFLSDPPGLEIRRALG